MNPSYIVLFVLMLDHCYGAKPNVEHSCDPLAMNIATARSNREGPDADNQAFSIRAFISYAETEYYLARATPNLDKSPFRYIELCHVPFHGRSCGPLLQTNKFPYNYYEYFENSVIESLLGIQFSISMIGMSLENGKSTLYKMDVKGINEDDYIFQWVEDTPITAFEIDSKGQETQKLKIPPNVLKRLKSEFAIYAIGIESPSEKSDDEASRSRSEEEFEEVPEISGTPNEDDDVYFGRARNFVIFITCDGKSIWATYNKWVVDENSEAETADRMDYLIRQLQKTVKQLNLLGENNYPNVKPVSTYKPRSFNNKLV